MDLLVSSIHEDVVVLSVVDGIDGVTTIVVSRQSGKERYKNDLVI